MTTPAAALTFGWRLIYTIALVVAVLTATYGSYDGGWLGAATGGAPGRFAIPRAVLAVLVLGRLVWVWCRPQVLTWPAKAGLEKLAKIALIASLGSVAGLMVMFGAGSFIGTLDTDVRGAVGLVGGLFLLPFMGLAPTGLVVFELVRGWSARASIPAADRVLLVIAAVTGVLLVLTPSVSSTLFPSSSLTRAQYDGALPWLAFALGLGALIIRGFRGDRFPSSAVFAMTMTGYFVSGWLMPFLWPEKAGHLFAGGGVLRDGATFALVVALVPAAALGLLGAFRADRAWAARALLGLPLASAVAWLGVSTTRFMQPSRSVSLMSGEQLSAQADHLRRRCAEAGSQVFRREWDVTQLEIRFPDEQGRRSVPMPDDLRPFGWFPRPDRGAPYERVILVRKGERVVYGLEARDVSGYTRLTAEEDVHPRYVLTWSSLQTAQEQADGVIGNEMSIIDTQDSSVLARRVLFFSRTNERSGAFWEACGTLGPRYLVDTYIHDWVRTILIPKPTA